MHLNGLLLYVRDVDRSLAFYRDVLGLPIVGRPAPHMGIVRVGASVLYLHTDPADMSEWMKQGLGGKYRGIGTLLHIQVDDVHEFHRALLAQGVEIAMGPVDQPFGQRHLYLYDPDGYNIVLMQPI